MQLLRRGGHPARPKLKPDQVDQAVEGIRKAQADKLAANVQEGKRAKEREGNKRVAGSSETPPTSGPVGAATQHLESQSQEETRAGWKSAPEGLADFAPTDMETPLALLMQGHLDDSWTRDHAKPAARLARLHPEMADDEVKSRQQAMERVEASGLIPDMPQHLGVYLRNRLAAITGRSPTAEDVQSLLEEAIREGGGGNFCRSYRVSPSIPKGWLVRATGFSHAPGAGRHRRLSARAVPLARPDLPGL